jgi:two-component system, OmpR family, sensor kinase
VTLRARLLFAVAALLVMATVACNVASVTALRSYLTNQLDEQLMSATDPLIQRVGPIFPLVEENTAVPFRLNAEGAPRQIGFGEFYVEVRRSDGSVETEVPAILREDDEPGPDLTREVIEQNIGGQPFTLDSTEGSGYRYRAVVIGAADGSGTISIAAPLANVDQTVDRLIAVEAVVTVVALAVLVAAGWVIIRNDLRPIEHMANAATAISKGDLSRRVERADDESEIGRLGLAFNTMISKIETSFDENQRSADRLRQFAADASHELRTPLTAVRGYAELYRQGAIVDDAHLARVMGRIESESQRMSRVVEELLLLARLDQDRPLEKHRVDLGDVAGNAVADARVIDSSRNIELVADGSYEVMGDPEKLHQVVSNLLTNALTHTPAGTPVKVGLRQQDGEVLLSVADEGPGFEPEQAAMVFERFYRVDPGRSRAAGGTGLGLSIVQAIVKAHGGSVSATSAPGEGASFDVRLPGVVLDD